MALRIYNTMSGKKEEFIPREEKKVRMYTCGITAYDYSHIGHARAAVVFDTVVRYLRYRGYEVTYVRNFTDVDDKIINKSNREGVPSSDIARKFIEEYRNDMQALGTLAPDQEPLATENIPDMIKVITTLVDKGHAYVVEGDVYFAVDSFTGYGKLSGRNIEEMIAGSRVDVDERKKNPLDFALWKSAKPGEPWWESPWGQGRPGWHIECSVMSTRILGDTLDIHGGGKDLIFPHHENEIAQAEAATGRPFARYWMHNGFVTMDREKMSKSIGNVLNIRDLLKEYHPEVLRYFLLSIHYRSPLDFSPESIQEVENALGRLYFALDRMDQASAGRVSAEVPDDRYTGDEREIARGAALLREQFIEAMDDDFNTALAIGNLFPLVKNVNRLLDALPGPPGDSAVTALLKARDALLEVCGILGILRNTPREFSAFLEKRGLDKARVDRGLIDSLVAERTAARKAKNWARADELRKQLSDMNVVLEDRSEGTVWKMG